MRIRTILAAAAAPAALAAVLLGTAGQASAQVVAPQAPISAQASQKAEGTIRLTQHPDTDFQGANWALDDVTHHQVVTNIGYDSLTHTYSYDVTYDEHGTFTTNAAVYHSNSRGDIAIPQGANGVMSGTGSLHVTGASQVPDMKYLKSLDNPTSISGILAPSVGWAGTSNYHYDYQYKIPSTSFTAEQSDNPGNNVP